MFWREQEPIVSAELQPKEPKLPSRTRGELGRLGQIGIALTAVTTLATLGIKYGPWPGDDDPCRIPPTGFGPSVSLSDQVSSPDGSRKSVSLIVGEDSNGNSLVTFAGKQIKFGPDGGVVSQPFGGSVIDIAVHDYTLETSCEPVVAPTSASPVH